jgi:hypothetical protein
MYWFDTLVTDMDDRHLSSAKAKAEEILTDIYNQIDECEEWQDAKKEKLGRKAEDYEAGLAAVSKEIERRKAK